jgi:uncharacterized protein
MKLNIQKCQLQEQKGPFKLVITERLPFYVKNVDIESVYYTVQRFKDFYLLTLEVNAHLKIECQRCMHDFNYMYNKVNNLAVCKSDEIAEKLMTEHEPLVSLSNEIDLIEIITDDLHLFCPEIHDNLDVCLGEN